MCICNPSFRTPWCGKPGCEEPEQRAPKQELFWVAELVHSGTGHALGGQYWNGETRRLFEPVTTTNIHEALQFRDAASCQEQIDRCGQTKAGVLKPVEHAWMRPRP